MDEGRKHGALRPQKPLRLIRDGEVGGGGVFGDQPAGDWVTSRDSVHDVLVNKKSNAMLEFILFSTEENLCPSSVVVSPKFFHLISQSPRMFLLYLSISCVSPWSFLAALSVLVFHVPMVMLSLLEVLRIFDDAPVAY